MTDSQPAKNRLHALLEVASAIASERDLDVLLRLILHETTVVADADRGTLFLIDPDTGELWSKLADGVGQDAEIRFPATAGIAGHVASTGQVVLLNDAYADPRFNRQVDRDTGYRTRSLLAVPLREMRGDIVGVLQVLNKKSGPFDQEDADVLLALAGQAAAAIQNALLHQDIKRLFEGFVKASVVAIESRDPTTAGHSERVAALTLGLADALEGPASPKSSVVMATAERRLELRYAALLHDVGKFGVRETVLTKAEKLYPHELEHIRQRFAHARARLEAESLRKRLQLAIDGAALTVIDREDKALQARLEAFAKYLELIESCNRPGPLMPHAQAQILLMRELTFPGQCGEAEPLLTAQEAAVLTLPRGNLTDAERHEVEGHVSHTFRFLSQIPWTRALRRVPEIAHGHHEKMDGSGYPRGIHGNELCIEARMIAVADVYDALTAADRPYRKAAPHELAARILREEAARGLLDSHLVEVFLTRGVPQRVLNYENASPQQVRRVSGVFSKESL